LKRALIWLSLAVVLLPLTTTMPYKASLIQGTTEIPTTNATIAATERAGTGTPTLRSLAEKRNFYMGAAVAYAPLLNVQKYRDTLRTQYNMVVAENAMKWDATEPGRNNFDFTQADAIVDFATANKMQIRGHNLIWYKQLPDWLNSGTFTRDELLDIMRNHIQKLVGHYKGRIRDWDVVNEAVADDGSLRNNLWLSTIGPDYIEQAFRFAHEADPDAKLFYNDYGGENTSRKANAIFKFVSDLKSKGVPIDGVGLQMHIGIGASETLNPAEVTANMDRLTALGLEVQITEMDVKMQNGTGYQRERLAAQAELYANMLRVCLQHPGCTAFLSWGFTDEYSWIPRDTKKDDAPLPFDKSYQPKPALGALLNVLSAQ